jgi:molecular chaperone DnaK
MIPRNTTIPTQQDRRCSQPYSDSQPGVEIRGAAGRAPDVAATTRRWARSSLDGIPPAPRGTPQIEVTFDIDANGILHVSAKDLGTGKDQKITIHGSVRPLQGRGREDDARTRNCTRRRTRSAKRRSRRKNQLDSAVYQLEKTIKDAGDKLPAAIKSKGEAAIADAKRSSRATTSTA